MTEDNKKISQIFWKMTIQNVVDSDDSRLIIRLRKHV